ncbi:hypothetical protein tb265_26320 [Gemmatimonadetes bacterium T265]|nr:hypothetical protein tb265_26320 [Gemmatimonadetes bacterium T265]
MHTASVLLFLAKTTLVLVAALGAARVLGRAPAGARHVVWLVTLGALLFVVPALAVWAPLRLTVWPAAAVLPAPASDNPSRPVAVHRNVPVGDDAASAIGRELETPSTTTAPSSSQALAAPRAPDVGSVLLALWAAVALGIGASLVGSWLAVRRIVRRAQPLDAPEWRDPLWEIADRFGLDEPPRLVRSGDANMPFACGLGRPTIVLPAACDGWTLDRRRAVLLHEVAHVRRRDLAGHTLARVVCAVYWFHPLVWTAAKRLRAESERACDDLALACGARAADYAEHLLDIVTSVRRDATPGVALAMARRTEFEGRMLDILDPERSRATPTRRQLVPLVGTLALVTIVVGAAAPASAAPHSTAPRPRDTTVVPPSTRAVAAGTLAAREPAASVAPRAARPGPPEAPAARPAASSAPAAPRGASDAPPAAPPANVNADVPRARAPEHTPPDDTRAELLARVLRADTSASLRRIAAWGLAEYANVPAAVAALATAVRGDRDAAVRETAAWALAEADRDAAARDMLGAALRADADARVRETAAWALGTAGDAAAAAALAAALGDASPAVRAAAVWGLGSVGPHEAPRALVALLADRDPKVRRLTAWALYTIEDPAAVPALQAALRTEADPELRIAYVRALAALGEQSVDALRTLLDSPDARIKAAAVRALAGAGGSGFDPWPWPWPRPRPFP